MIRFSRRPRSIPGASHWMKSLILKTCLICKAQFQTASESNICVECHKMSERKEAV